MGTSDRSWPKWYVSVFGKCSLDVFSVETQKCSLVLLIHLVGRGACMMTSHFTWGCKPKKKALLLTGLLLTWRGSPGTTVLRDVGRPLVQGRTSSTGQNNA